MPVYIDNYPMDLAVSETHGFESEATAHPVERGADITDHVRAKPITLELECIVSDTPLEKLASDATRQGSTLPSEDAYAHLLAIRDARQPVTVETSLGSFASMALISLSVPRAADKSGGLFFSVSFQQVRIVENKRTTVRVAIPIAKRSTNYGTKASGKADPAGVTWRKGKPPGGALIVGTEQVYFFTLLLATSVVYHADRKTVLTDAERKAFDLDMKRDASLVTAGESSLNEDDRVRAEQLRNEANPKPGKYVSPKLFGL